MLSRNMAGKASLLARIIRDAIIEDQKEGGITGSAKTAGTLKEHLTVSGNILVRDVTPGDFARIIAQTISYGMFAARLYCPVAGDFTRQKAVEFIPEPYLILRRLFQYLGSPDVDQRIIGVIDEIAELLRTTDMVALLGDFDEMHFHEDFLQEYNPESPDSKHDSGKRGPMVAFIAEAVRHRKSLERERDR